MKAVRTYAAVLAMAAVALLGAATLSAHMKVEKSEPAASAEVTGPVKQVQIYFSEVPDAKVSKLEVKGPSPATRAGALKVAEKSIVAAIEGNTPAGVYTVAWQTAGGDGHIQKGDFTFTVK